MSSLVSICKKPTMQTTACFQFQIPSTSLLCLTCYNSHLDVCMLLVDHPLCSRSSLSGNFNTRERPMRPGDGIFP